ncbi:S8 family peptidase [Rhodococcus koreensis]|uniref:Subtilase family protein n=1 Tax=Rhodococcus koreensis TaxID=99653 RepID=A0A1H4I5C9_9NOCA|nr:S8 family serine peptidase [Rhodococcus koreensis]SEB29131.1 Subtilase family protein [Rhodococcus koreensis]
MTSASHRKVFDSSRTEDSVVYLRQDVIPPLGGPGRLIGPQTLLIANDDLPALVEEKPIGDVFNNAVITFDLDKSGGGGAATFVDNDDNWGIGTDGLNVKTFWNKGVLGHGVRVGIADSGMDSTHPSFEKLTAEKRLKGFAQFDRQGNQVLQKRPDGTVIPDSVAIPTFGHLHGTHCAAIIVGEGPDGKDRGVAPGAELVVTRVLEQSNTGSVAQIAAGLSWLATQKCDIASLSLGWPGLHEEWASPVKALLDAGVIVVVAVGNEFDAAGVAKSRSPANYLVTPGPTDGLLIAVGAHEQAGTVWESSGGETVSWADVTVLQTDGTSRQSIFASQPPRIVPGMVAPGVEIISAAPFKKYLPLDGSSMATPHVAGLIALVLSHLRSSDPGARPRTAAELMLTSLKDLAPIGLDIRSGAGRVDNSALAHTVIGP